jgi:hypothetical protein
MPDFEELWKERNQLLRDHRDTLKDCNKLLEWQQEMLTAVIAVIQRLQDDPAHADLVEWIRHASK